MRSKQLKSKDVPDKLRVADLVMRNDMNSEPREALGLLVSELERTGELEHVVRVCTTLLDLFPNDPDVLHSLARAKLRLGAAEEAVDHLESALLQMPDDISLLQALASAYGACGQDQNALAVTNEIADLHRHNNPLEAARSAQPADSGEPATAPSIILTEEFSS
jgi:Flp pilus assembly protein TadD